MARPALPDDVAIQPAMPAPAASDTDIAATRSLYEPVGLSDSSLAHTAPTPSRAATRGSGTTGVSPSPRLTNRSTAGRSAANRPRPDRAGTSPTGRRRRGGGRGGSGQLRGDVPGQLAQRGRDLLDVLLGEAGGRGAEAH